MSWMNLKFRLNSLFILQLVSICRIFFEYMSWLIFIHWNDFWKRKVNHMNSWEKGIISRGLIFFSIFLIWCGRTMKLTDYKFGIFQDHAWSKWRIWDVRGGLIINSKRNIQILSSMGCYTGKKWPSYIGKNRPKIGWLGGMPISKETTIHMIHEKKG